MENNSPDMSDLLNNLNSMMNNGTIPDNVKNIINNIKNNNSNNAESNSSINTDNISNIINMFNNSNNSNTSSNNANSTNIDFETILKIKSIMEKMNNRNDPRSNLLLSLKPYLKESRKNKIEQYIQLFNMTSVIDVLNSNKTQDSNK